MLRSPVVRVKLWTLDGRVAYSDATRLIGRRFAWTRRAARRPGGRVAADISDARRPENEFERGLGKLLEVYLPVRTPGGRRLLYEEYLRYAAIADSSRRQWLALLPAFGGALLVLALAQLPLAWWLARRLQQREEEREALLAAARRVVRPRAAPARPGAPRRARAGGGRPGVAPGRRRPAGRPRRWPATLDAGRRGARDTVREMRSLLVTLHPPNLRRVGLQAALSDIAAPLLGAGVEVDLDVAAPPTSLRTPRRSSSASPRRRCATPTSTRVRAMSRCASATTTAACAWRPRRRRAASTPDELAGRRSGGHRGLALLEDLAADAGGRLT